MYKIFSLGILNSCTLRLLGTITLASWTNHLSDMWSAIFKNMFSLLDSTISLIYVMSPSTSTARQSWKSQKMSKPRSWIKYPPSVAPWVSSPVSLSSVLLKLFTGSSDVLPIVSIQAMNAIASSECVFIFPSKNF